MGQQLFTLLTSMYNYVSDWDQDSMVMYIAPQITSLFGKCGRAEGKLHYPRCIISCANGFIDVCDHNNNRVQVL